jgi:lysophospholipase L1-like esterase
MIRRICLAAALSIVIVPATAVAQANFQKTGYHVAMGDSVVAGEGAMPVTTIGYAYQLYEQGVFGTKQQMDFANVSVRGGRSWDLLAHQVPQVLCAEPAQRPTVVTITAGANDFLRGDVNVPAIAARVASAVNQLLNNDNGHALPVLDPVTNLPCRRLQNVTILVSNYYRIPHPDPAVAAQFNAALQFFDFFLRQYLQAIHVPAGSRVALVDLYAASEGYEDNFVLLNRPGGYDIHPTNLGHSLIAAEFAKVWQGLQ